MGSCNGSVFERAGSNGGGEGEEEVAGVSSEGRAGKRMAAEELGYC